MQHPGQYDLGGGKMNRARSTRMSSSAPEDRGGAALLHTCATIQGLGGTHYPCSYTLES